MKNISVPIEIKRPQSLRERRQALTKAEYKNSKLRVKPEPRGGQLSKPDWIRAKLPTADKLHRVAEIKRLLRDNNLHSVCEEASCPNLPECFSKGTATFMVMGSMCTRKCPFCDVAHGRPLPLDKEEPRHLAQSIRTLNLKYVVITSVNRDDLKDGGAQHFADCINSIRDLSPDTKIEILTPDFRRTESLAIEIISKSPPDVFNHNLETVPRLYREVRPGADYQRSLKLLQSFKRVCPSVATKSGIMVGLGEGRQEVLSLLADLRLYSIDMLTVGQYLQPSRFHLDVKRYVSLEEFDDYAQEAKRLGFVNVASGPLVRSSYHADLQAEGIAVV